MFTSCSTVDATTWYEAMARGFQRASGMMAPGKDVPAAYGAPWSFEERRTAWAAWRELLGPSDVASIVAVQMLKDRSDDE